ncbi:MAG: MBL fold metallo-hydrolase [Candidatus Thorarchaeota archaeon]
MVNISFLGGCREVGASAILIESNEGNKCILDYGVRFNNDDRLPYNGSIDNLKAIALSHCHIDHSGALPYLYKEFEVPLYTNSITLRISEILLKDMIKISNYPYPFGFRELDRLRRNAYFLDYGIKKKIADNFYITFYDAGHIPGSVSILVEVNKKKIFYTGDINTINTNLVKPANSLDLPELDALIIESTYALREHPPRDDLEKDFIDKITNVTEDGGKILIPAFGVARSQEILLILHKYNFKGKIFVDGLARKISSAYLNYPMFLRNPKNFKSALKKSHFVSKKNRKAVVNKPGGIIISPSGMLKGGAAINYIKKILPDPSSGIYMVGYQVEGTPGRMLLDEGIFIYKESLRRRGSKIGDFSIKAECDFDYFDFSSHADKHHLYQYINNLKFQDKSEFIFCVHGEEKATTNMAKDLSKLEYISVAPETGETYKI